MSQPRQRTFVKRSAEATAPAEDPFWKTAAGWITTHPAEAFLLFCSGVLLAYFFGFLALFQGRELSTFQWAWSAWNPETNYEHAKLIPPIALFLVWYHRKALREAAKEGSPWGIPFLCVGFVIFLAGARTLQPRLSLIALPFLIFGMVLFLWGKPTARILLFPIWFLLFMVPLNTIEHATFRLQFIITGVSDVVLNMVGISVYAVGTNLNAADGSFGFEIAGGCSGIKSLMAMTMVTAIYVHLTQRELWKKLLIFAGTALFAVIGNIGRIVTIILFARFIDPELAGGLYHDYSGFIFFPIALMAMLGFSKLVNVDYAGLWRGAAKPDDGDNQGPPAHGATTEKKPLTYDY